jgi:hypothetical protein
MTGEVKSDLLWGLGIQQELKDNHKEVPMGKCLWDFAVQIRGPAWRQTREWSAQR